MRLALCTAVLLAVVHPVAEAQVQPNTTGFYLAGHINGSALSVEGDPVETGGGAGIDIGWGFGEGVVLFLAGDAAVMDGADGTSTYDLAHGDLGIRYLFTAPGRRWVPFIGGSFTGWLAEVEVVDQGQRFNVDVGGGGLTVAGGINYFLSATFALTSTMQWTFGRFTEASVEGVNVPIDNFDGRSARFNLGFAWFPVR